MRASVSIPLAGLFVFLAAINVWIMLTGLGRHSTRPPDLDTGPSCLRVCLHILVRDVLLLHVTAHQVADELSARIILHFSLAFILVPLVLVKVIVVRFQKSAWNTLVTLGITICAIAFTLVSMNVAVHYLRDIVPHKVPFAISPDRDGTGKRGVKWRINSLRLPPGGTAAPARRSYSAGMYE